MSKLRTLTLIGAAIAIGIVVYGYLALIPPELKIVELTDYEVNCSSEVRAGKRYMWIKDSHERIYDSLSRIENCESLSGLGSKAVLSYRESNMTIFGLKVNGKTLISTEESLQQRANSAIYFEVLLSLVLLGVVWSIL